MKAVVEMKTADVDGFFAGMRAMVDNELDQATVAEATAGRSATDTGDGKGHGR